MIPNRLRMLALVMLWAGAALASDGLAAQRPGGPPPRAELQRRIQERFNEVVQEELGISDDQARQLRDLSVELMERRRALATRHGELQERLAEVGPASTDAEARQVLDELRSLHRAEADLVAEEIDRLLEVIEPAGVARFYALRQRMMQRIEARRGGAPGPAGPFRGGPGMRPRGGGR